MSVFLWIGFGAMVLVIVAIAWVFGDMPNEPAPPERE